VKLNKTQYTAFRSLIRLLYILGETIREKGMLLVTFCILDLFFLDRAIVAKMEIRAKGFLWMALAMTLFGTFMQFAFDPDQAWLFLRNKNRRPGTGDVAVPE
jgi:hypothetical protein